MKERGSEHSHNKTN